LFLISQPHGMLPSPSAATSAPVSTPITPGAALAAAMSMPLILACAYIERTNTA
jgi:hypothetical protein